LKKDRLLNPEIVKEVAALGHTEFFVIADCGLPVPKGVKVIDVSVVHGIPSFTDVLKAVSAELVIESAVIASEIEDCNQTVLKEIMDVMGEKPVKKVPHEELKVLCRDAKCIVRTGEASSYANIVLVGGVNF